MVEVWICEIIWASSGRHEICVFHAERAAESCARKALAQGNRAEYWQM